MRALALAVPAVALRLVLSLSLALYGLPSRADDAAAPPATETEETDQQRDAYSQWSGSVTPLMDDTTPANAAARQWLAERLPAEFQARFSGNELTNFLRDNPRLAAELLYVNRSEMSRLYRDLPDGELKRSLAPLFARAFVASTGDNTRWQELQRDFEAWARTNGKDVANPEHYREYLAQLGRNPTTIARIFHAPARLGSTPSPTDRQPGLPGGGTGGHSFQWDANRFNRLIFNSSEIYGRSGEPHVWTGTDSSGRRRVFSMQLIEVSQGHHAGADPPITRMSVTDITDPQNPVQFTVALNDPRIAAGQPITPEGMGAFTISRGSSGGLQLAVPGVRWSQPGQAMTVEQMQRYRAERVRSYGYVVKVAGREYYIFGQGYGDQTNLTYWDKAQLDAAMTSPSGGADLRPSMVSSAVRKRVDGVDQRQDVVHLGEAGGKWQALKWNGDQNRFEVTDTLTRPTAPAPGATPGGSTPPGGPTGTLPGGFPATFSTGEGATAKQFQAATDLADRLPPNLRERMMFYRTSDGQTYAAFGREPLVPFPMATIATLASQSRSGGEVSTVSRVDVRQGAGGRPLLFIEGRTANGNTTVVTYIDLNGDLRPRETDGGFGIDGLTTASYARYSGTPPVGTFSNAVDEPVIRDFAQRLGLDPERVMTFVNRHRASNPTAPVGGSNESVMVHVPGAANIPLMTVRNGAYTETSAAAASFTFVGRTPDPNLPPGVTVFPMNMTRTPGGNLRTMDFTAPTPAGGTGSYTLVGTPADARMRGAALYQLTGVAPSPANPQLVLVARVYGADGDITLPAFDLGRVSVTDPTRITYRHVNLGGNLPANTGTMAIAIPPGITGGGGDLTTRGMIALYDAAPNPANPNQGFRGLVAWWGYDDEAAARRAAGLPAP